MNVALMCMAMNEDNYIDEWIEYHRKLGVSKFVIYQNNWRYKGKYTDRDFVELIEFDGTRKHMESFNNFIRDYHDKFDWAGFIDVDEFVVLKNHNNISDFLAEYNDYEAVGLNWNMIGSNGLEFTGEYSVLKRFTKCRKQLHSTIKCFINFNRAKNTLHFRCPHNVEEHNKIISVDKTHFINAHADENNANNRNIAYINHYYTKTKQEWQNKVLRNWVGAQGRFIDKKEYDEYYNSINTPEFSEYEDLTAYNFMYGDNNS